MSRKVQVSPRHQVVVSDDYVRMLVQAPREDFVVRTLARRTAGNMTLMMGELVIAGAATREHHPRAQEFPLHFRKTYYPGRMHGNPHEELRHHETASQLIGLPPPIGATHNSFRSCLLPGTPLDRLSKLGTEPDESNIAVAQELDLAAAAGMWRLLEEAYLLVKRLQAGGLSHGDCHLHNFILCPSPLEVLPIDFEIAASKTELTPEAWTSRCASELDPILKFALYLQCALGKQHSELGKASREALERLVQPSARFNQVISAHSFDV